MYKINRIVSYHEVTFKKFNNKKGRNIYFVKVHLKVDNKVSN